MELWVGALGWRWRSGIEGFFRCGSALLVVYVLCWEAFSLMGFGECDMAMAHLST